MAAGLAAGPEAASEAEAALAAEALRLLRIEPSAAGDPSVGRADGAAGPGSRNAQRKRRRWQRVLAARRDKRRQERQRRRAQRAAADGDGPRPALDSGPAGPVPPSLRCGRVPAALAAERLLEARAAGPRLCVDLGVGGSMTEKESGRLASQIRRLYGANRRAARPFWLCLTEFAAGTPIYEQCFRMNDGFAGYLMDTTPESYLDLFPLEAIVYLTPDSENVFDVLSTYYETRSWPAALRAGVSSGKGYVLPDTAEQVETPQCAIAAQENSLFCGEGLHRQEAPA
ncbi:tRNA methyltransferase 10 homolog B isoform 2-T2 [Sylvia borin]